MNTIITASMTIRFAISRNRCTLHVGTSPGIPLTTKEALMSDTLAFLIANLERLINDVRHELSNIPPGLPPELAKDANGRYILLDAYAALGQLYAALAALDSTRPG